MKHPGSWLTARRCQPNFQPFRMVRYHRQAQFLQQTRHRCNFLRWKKNSKWFFANSFFNSYAGGLFLLRQKILKWIFGKSDFQFFTYCRRKKFLRKKSLSSFLKVFLGQIFRKRLEYDEWKLKDLHKDHPTASVISNSAYMLIFLIYISTSVPSWGISANSGAVSVKLKTRSAHPSVCRLNVLSDIWT